MKVYAYINEQGNKLNYHTLPMLMGINEVYHELLPKKTKVVYLAVLFAVRNILSTLDRALQNQ